jgi:hypothetical protein
MTDLTSAGVRRVVTYRDSEGRSRIHAEDRAPRVIDFVETPGMRVSALWATDPGLRGSDQIQDPIPTLASCHPTNGGSVFMTLTIPPATVFSAETFNPQKSFEEQFAALPGIVERMEPDAPGFHATDSIDYFILLVGELWLVVDDGEETKLSPGDVVIQQGTRHAWQNRGNTAATFAVVLLGAQPSLSQASPK